MNPLSQRTGTRAPTRRQHQRRATVAEIKKLAREQLAEAGPSAVSLRAIAREMGMASSAIYRYFGSHGDLIGALCVDAYNFAADALTAARDAQPAADNAGQMWAILHAYRRWSLDHTADFTMLFGTPVPGFQASVQVTGPAAGRFAAVPLEAYLAAVNAGEANPNRTQVPETIRAGGNLTALLEGVAIDYPPQLAAIVFNAWSCVYGYLCAEIFGSLAALIADTDQLFDAHLRAVLLDMGFRPISLPPQT